MTDSFETPPSDFGGSTPQQGGAPAEFVPRLIARLIDFGIAIALFIPVLIISTVIGFVSDILGFLTALVLYPLLMVAFIYIVVGGIALTGQTPGQRMQGVKVMTDGGQLLGWGGSLIRWLVGGVFNSIVCGLPIGSLWMLWDGEKKTLYDKVLNSKAVAVPTGSITPIFPGGNPI